ncbi:sigma-E factor regulatory protein RseB domain-containing protein [Rhizohabitans arisaemae]|uniref:sigma-E factor regulatory protein RseB domain-containing protein n=1 Tax=Rhizohabitans arisaemae TaxID=2720610 RepID=UPI0024B2610C|nr:sigma-E factor regulatory protein RseB domain-containing protein [Rhizohabitans arisaemae]
MSNPAHAVVPVDPGEGEDTGLPLLRSAAGAGRDRGYTGVQFVTSWGRGGSRASLVEITHVPGRGSTLRTPATGTSGSTEVLAADPGDQLPSGGLTAPSEGMLDILSRNYRVADVGRGSVCGRASRIVEARRGDGTAAARFWIDEKTSLLLRREIIDSSGRIAHAGAFIDLRIDGTAAKNIVVATPFTPLETTRLADLRNKGWSFPGTLPGRLELFAAADGLAPSGPYLHLSYSDGLSVLSVFVQRGRLDESRLVGWHSQRLRDHTIWVRNAATQETVWAGGGHIYTVLANAPGDTVDAAIQALPHEPPPGVWDQLVRGFGRVVAWVNPFE